MSESYRTLIYEVADNVLTLTLNRPDKVNAFNVTMCEEMVDAFDRSDADPDIRAVIVTGAGKYFCGGFELDGSGAFDAGVEDLDWSALPADHPVRDLGGRLTLRLFDSLKPIIAAVNGAAVGIGATMLLPMDYRLAATNARVGFVFSRRGIVPEACSSWFLPRIVGINRALDWTLSGRLVPDVEAAAAGFFGGIHAPEELLPAARRIAAELVRHVSPVSASLTRQMMWRGLTLDHPIEAHRVDSRLMALRGRHGDAREGVAAFLEKRDARFPGRVPDDLPSVPWWAERNFS